MGHNGWFFLAHLVEGGYRLLTPDRPGYLRTPLANNGSPEAHGKQVTLTPGETFYEGPNDVHIVGRSASNTQPAKFLVFLVKEKGAPVLVPVK